MIVKGHTLYFKTQVENIRMRRALIKGQIKLNQKGKGALIESNEGERIIFGREGERIREVKGQWGTYQK